jgi:hypothetical protein
MLARRGACTWLFATVAMTCAALGCHDDHGKPKTAEVKAGSAAAPAPPVPAKKVSLGGGYRDAKWGMTKAQVAAALKLKPAEDSADFLLFKLGDTESVKCWFKNDRLYRVEYHPLNQPGISDEQLKATSEGILRTLRDRYGEPEMPADMADGMGIPFDLFAQWDDGATKLKLEVLGVGTSKVIAVYEGIGEMAQQARDEEQETQERERRESAEREQRIQDEARKQGSNL